MLAFELGWNVLALAVFGLHLMLLGVMVARTAPAARDAKQDESSQALILSDAEKASAFTRAVYGVGNGACGSTLLIRALALSLVIAGVGYVGDSGAKLYYLPGVSPVELSASGTSIGEVFLMVYLLVRYAGGD